MNNAMKTAEILDSLGRKFHPHRFSGMSPKMAFIIGSIVGQHWAKGPRGESPDEAHYSISSDGFVTCGSMFLGSADEFEDNLGRLVEAAELNEEEMKLFHVLYRSHVTDWRLGDVGNIFQGEPAYN